ncbi:MAG: acetamidase/formamidase family protein [Abditibacteriaceae bacterium]
MKIIDGSKVVHSFKPDMVSIESVNSDETFKVVTHDCFYGQIKSESQTLESVDYSKLNPATGPIDIEGAQPGDILKIRIVEIDPTSNGVSLTMPNQGALGYRAKRPLTKTLNIENGYCHFNDLKIPVKPMIGVIGVATSAADGEINTATPWKHGGNMDTKYICEGSILYLLVNQPNAQLALGDCHAIMGDGEICFTGCEIAAEVTLEVEILKDKNITWPVVETNDYTMVIASGETIDDAIASAADKGIEYLMNGLNISWEEAYILASLNMEIGVSQVVNPKKTVRAAISKSLLSTDKLLVM